MSNFYIDKLIITGVGKRTSSITFSKELNIICGPSDTGKTYIVKCIDYLFGSDKNPIDPATGYDTITLCVNTLSGSINMSRKLDSKKINVQSSNPSIESGEYDAKMQKSRYNKSISSVWLRLIGISKQIQIIMSETFKKQTLSWRTFLHTFFLDEHRIITEDSILLPKSPTGNTALISCLLFLITGNDYGEMTQQEDQKTKEIRKKAVIHYINKELSWLADRNNELIEQSSNMEDIDYESEIENIIEEIAGIEQKISLAIQNNQAILQQLSNNNQQLTECNVLLNRYEELKTQYVSDMKRLNFIIDGAANKQTTYVQKCPFCDAAINNTNEQTYNYIEASKAEYKKVNLQLKDLIQVTKDLENEKSQLEIRTTTLKEEQNRIEQVVNSQLRPKVQPLKDKLAQYKQYVEIQKEIRMIKEFCSSKTTDLIEVESEDGSALKFKVKEHLDRTMLDVIDQLLYILLDKCNYNNLLTARFDKNEMDIVVNGKAKRNFGKGYCAFFNVIVATAFAQYIKEKGKFPLSLLILDSPILSLKESKTAISKSMKSGLFAYFSKNPSDLQIIIVENEIPEDIDYGDSNIIRFTKDANAGRYGLLYDVM